MNCQNFAANLSDQEMMLVEGGNMMLGLGRLWLWLGVASAYYDFWCGFLDGLNNSEDQPIMNPSGGGGGW